MRFASIASGSSGNCLYIGSGSTNILIDAGISKKKIEEGLSGLGLTGSDIDAVLITHEHSDHVKGIGVWSRKYHVPIYATKGTLMEISRMSSLGKIDPSLFHPVKEDQDFSVEDLQIHPISVSHDARDPVCYRVDDGRRRIGTVTDLGRFDDYITQSLGGCDLLYVEANHDTGMLETGPYPYPLKVRIAGNYGHLSNEMSARLIGSLNNSRLHNVILGHLSKENNFPDLALETVRAELFRDHDKRDINFSLSVAPRDKASETFSID